MFEKRYDELEKVEGLKNATAPVLLCEKEGILYYIVIAKITKNLKEITV